MASKNPDFIKILRIKKSVLSYKVTNTSKINEVEQILCEDSHSNLNFFQILNSANIVFEFNDVF